jgi:superfamily II DNA or RNA helicase
MEGLEIFKIYLSFVEKYKGKYGEFHGDIDKEVKKQTKNKFNLVENKHGELMKIMMISPSGSEGINLRAVRQIHILEPYWNEVRIEQIIGRGIRQLSHSDLPLDERHVDVYRYKVISKDGSKISTDQHIEQGAMDKERLTQSFLMTIKEAAVDCVLNKNHNMVEQKYSCFQFEEESLFSKYVGPAYKEDMDDDIRMNNGSNSINSITKQIKVMKIKAVIELEPEKYSEPSTYWYYDKSGTVYDYELFYAVGRVPFDENNLPLKLDRETYIIKEVIDIPTI